MKRTSAKTEAKLFDQGAGRALRRAAKVARKTARTHNTPIYVWQNGKNKWLLRSLVMNTGHIWHAHPGGCQILVPTRERRPELYAAECVAAFAAVIEEMLTTLLACRYAPAKLD